MKPTSTLTFILIFLIIGGFAFGQLHEPKSDPTFNETQAKPSQVDIDDASDVQLRRTEGPVDTEVAADDVTPPERHLVASPDNSPAPSFSVTTVRTGTKKIQPKGILLLTPAHNTIYTPGVITFSWKFATPHKKKVAVILKVERVDGARKFAKKVSKEKKLLDLSSGSYRWQVATVKPGQDSRWRAFKVEYTKSHSLTELYNGPTQSKKAKKPVKLQDVTAYIREVPETDEDATIEADDDEPLAIPNSLRRTPAEVKPQTTESESQLKTPDWATKK